MQNSDQRVPPQSIEAEQSVLGGIMLDNTMINAILEILRPEHFYKSAHQKIYSAMIDMTDKGDPVDIVTLNNYLKNKGILERVGDTSYITFLSSSIPTAANVVYYAKIIKEKATLRKTISVSKEIIEGAYYCEDVPTFIDESERSFLEVSKDSVPNECVSMSSLIAGTFKTIEGLFNKKQIITGISSGFQKIDKMLSGFQPADLIIIGGRPSMGKTAFAMNVAINAVAESAINAAIFSLEMSKDQLIMRAICSEAEVNMSQVRSGHMSDFCWPRLTKAAGKMSEIGARLFIDDTPSISPTLLNARCRRLQSEHGLGLVVVDYMQLMRIHGKVQSREQEIAIVSRELKALAKELNVPVIALSQLNRALEARPDKRPKLSDLRESGSIEQDADVIGFVYRDVVYNPKTEHPNVAEIIIAKQRNGPIGTIKLLFENKYTKFKELDERHKDDDDYNPDHWNG